MKRHSILTTLFPRLPIARYSIPQLLDKHSHVDFTAKSEWDLLPYVGKIRRTKHGLTRVVVPDFLPPVEILGKLLKCNLYYEERPAEQSTGGKPLFKDEQWVDNGRDVADNFLDGYPEKKNQAVVWTSVDVRSSKSKSFRHFKIEELTSGDTAEETLPKTAEERLHKVHQYMLDIFREADSGKDIAEIHFNISILICQGSCPGYEEPDEETDKEKYEARLKALSGIRREYLARELTTGYRRYVSLLLVSAWAAASLTGEKKKEKEHEVFKKVGKSCHIVDTGSALPNSDLHSTTEDAWRLLCTFDNVEDASKTVNREGKHQKHDYVLCLDSFMDSLVGDRLPAGETSTAIAILDYLYLNRGIKREIALRKTLEYYIYEGVPCMPGNPARTRRAQAGGA